MRLKGTKEEAEHRVAQMDEQLRRIEVHAELKHLRTQARTQEFWRGVLICICSSLHITQ